MISFIVPTVGRASLEATLASITCLPGDEVLVIGEVASVSDPRARLLRCRRGDDWGAKERTLGIAAARGSYLAFMDDDDIYLPGARDAMERAIRAAHGRPTLFRMRYPSGRMLWSEPALRCGNVSTQMMLIPNDPARLGRWSQRREGDFDFLASSGWSESEFVFDPEVVALMGRDDG